MLFTIFKRYLLENGVGSDHIVEIAVDRIRISRSNKVCFFDNYISSNCFIGNIIAEIVKVSSKENTALHNQILL